LPKVGGDALVGNTCDPASVKAAGDAMQTVIDSGTDNRGPVAFKRHSAAALLARAILLAWSRA